MKLKLFLILCLSCLIFGQSKTDKAKEKLAENDDDKKEKKENKKSDDDESDDSEIYFFIFQYMGNIVFNYDSELLPAKDIRYNSFPYDAGIKGIQNSISDFSSLFQFQLNYGKDNIDGLESRQVLIKAHLSGWAFISDFESMKEESATEGIEQFSLRVQRKAKFFDGFDMGISLGYHTVKIGTTFDGLELGFNSEVFPFQPLSIKYATLRTFLNNADIVNTFYEARIHFKQFYLPVRLKHFFVDDIRFKTLDIGFGTYF